MISPLFHAIGPLFLPRVTLASGGNLGAPLADATLSYYDFDEAGGNPLDALGRNNAVAMQGDRVQGIVKKGIQITSQNISASITSSASLQKTWDTPFTVCAWVYFGTVHPQFNWIACKWHYASGDQDWMLFSYQGQLNFQINNAGSLTLTQSMPLDRWAFVATTVSGSQANGKATIYLFDQDNVYQNSGQRSGGTSSDYDLLLGGTYGSNGASQIIDGVGIFDRYLSESELSYLYNAGAGRQYPFAEVESLI